MNNLQYKQVTNLGIYPKKMFLYYSFSVEKCDYNVRNCSYKCFDEHEFMCNSSKKCIPKRSRCDSIKDCDDLSDELNCKVKECGDKELEFKCKNNNCVRAAYQCDGMNDCGDNSDEHCGMLYFFSFLFSFLTSCIVQYSLFRPSFQVTQHCHLDYFTQNRHLDYFTQNRHLDYFTQHRNLDYLRQGEVPS